MPEAPFRNAPLLTHEQLQERLGELERAVQQYNDGWYFESHETLEDLWMVTPWPERQLFQAIIQLAAAFVHFARGEYPGILKLLDAAAEKLRDFQPAAMGLDVSALLEGTDQARRDLEALGPERFREWDDRKHRPRILGTAPK